MNCNSIWIVASVLVLSTLLPEAAFAVGSMRCGTHIISSSERGGPDKYEVLKKCGEPAARAGDTWTYKLTGGATRVVVFDSTGSVMRIS